MGVNLILIAVLAGVNEIPAQIARPGRPLAKAYGFVFRLFRIECLPGFCRLKFKFVAS